MWDSGFFRPTMPAFCSVSPLKGVAMHSTGSVEINYPIEDVFRIAMDETPQWSKIVVADEPIEQTPDVVGSRFRTVTEENGRRMEFVGKVLEHEPPRRCRIKLVGEMFDIDLEYVFEEVNGMTRVTQNSNVQGKGFTRLMFAAFGWLMRKSSCKAAEDELLELKRFCEQECPSQPC